MFLGIQSKKTFYNNISQYLKSSDSKIDSEKFVTKIDGFSSSLIGTMYKEKTINLIYDENIHHDEKLKQIIKQTDYVLKIIVLFKAMQCLRKTLTPQSGAGFQNSD